MNKSLLPLAALIAIAVPLIAQDAGDPFRDSDFDGHWTGTLRIGGVETPIAVNLGVTDGTALASVMLPDGEDREQTFDPFPTEVRRVKAKRVDLLVDSGREGNRSDEVTLILKYKKSSDTLRVKTRGALRGSGDLLRSDPGRPLRGIWGGDLLLALDETAERGSRLAATEISGFSWSDDADLRGPVRGTRNGDDVAFTLETGGGDLFFTGQLRDSDTGLRGELSPGSGNPGIVSMTRASGGGVLAVQRFAPSTVDAGATTSVTLSGRNLAQGLQIDTDVDGVRVTAVTVVSPKKATISVAVDAGIAAGTRVGLRVRNADGQVAEAANALTVRSGSGGGGPTPSVSFSGDVQPIFTNSCALSGCHAAGSGAGGMVLSAGDAFGNIVGVPSSQQPSLNRIQPGDADASYLVRKIRGDAGISGGRMPLNRTPLTDSQIQTIVDWVNQGAANNRLPGR